VFKNLFSDPGRSVSPQVNSSRSSSPGVIPVAPPSPNPGGASSLIANHQQRAAGVSKSSLSDVPCASLVRQVRKN
jgi:hypothetical protein